MSVRPTPIGPMSIVVSAIIEHTEDGVDKRITSGQLIERLVITIETPARRFHALEKHNVEIVDQPMEISWDTRMITASNAFLALQALQADREFFNLILQPVDPPSGAAAYDPKTAHDMGLPIKLIDCKVVRMERTNVSDDFPMADVRGIAREYSVNRSGYTEVSGGSDIPDAQPLVLANYAQNVTG